MVPALSYIIENSFMLPGALLSVYKHAITTIFFFFLIREGKKNGFDCPFNYFPVLPLLFRTKRTPPESCLYSLSPLPIHNSLYNLLYLGNPEGQFSVSTLSDLAVASDAGDNPIKLETLSSLGSQDIILS